MSEEKELENEQASRIILDPSKFTINADGQVTINDPSFAQSLRAAANEEADDAGHGISVGIVVKF